MKFHKEIPPAEASSLISVKPLPSSNRKSDRDIQASRHDFEIGNPMSCCNWSRGNRMYNVQIHADGLLVQEKLDTETLSLTKQVHN